MVSPKLLVQNSDYLETHLVAVPNSSSKEFLKSYETLVPMVVPRSANFVTQDDEFSLYAATTFKKHGTEFVHKCRERKWIPRDFKYREGGKEAEAKEVDKVSAEERKLWGETLRLGRTGWSEAVQAWIHIIVLRVFVETVLRYGLPLDFVCGLLTVSRRSAITRKIKLTCPDRPPEIKSQKQDVVWIRPFHTWLGMPSEGTRRGNPQKMTQPLVQKCRQLARATGSILHMCALIWKLSRSSALDRVRRIESPMSPMSPMNIILSWSSIQLPAFDNI